MSDDFIPVDVSPQDDENKPVKKRKFRWFLSFLVVLVIVATGFAMLYFIVKELGKAPKKPGDATGTGTETGTETQKTPGKEEQKPKIKVYKVAKDNFVHMMDTLGTIQAKAKVDLRFEVNGIAEVVNVKEGDHVRRDDIVAEIAHTDSELKIDFRKSKLKESQIEEKNAQARLTQYKELLDAGAITQSKYDEANFALERAKQATKSAKIELRSAESELEKTYLRTPIEGIIGEVKLQKGEFVTSQTIVVSVMEIMEVHCEFSVLEKDIQDVKEGLSIRIGVDTYPGEQFTGSIIALGAMVETVEGRARKVKALIQNPDSKLMPGMFAHVAVVLLQRDDAITVPVTAFADIAQDTSFVWILGEGDKVSKREIAVEHLSPEKALIESGLKVGDLVVVDVATVKLQDGQQVEVVEVKEGGAKTGAS